MKKEDQPECPEAQFCEFAEECPIAGICLLELQLYDQARDKGRQAEEQEYGDDQIVNRYEKKRRNIKDKQDKKKK